MLNHLKDQPPLANAPWSAAPTFALDTTFHQIAPYIGRMKTSMARSLVLEWTRPTDLIIDPFCGCGVIALEAAVLRRRVVAGDWNPYATLLTRAKLFPPKDLETAERRLARTWKLSRELLGTQNLESIPLWVSCFFHPDTLRSALAFRDACTKLNDNFLLAALLGILHHQRTGFLSYPSSHLVPYLRDKKFPRNLFPELYLEREVLPRLVAKIRRTFRRPPDPYFCSHKIVEVDARCFPKVRGVDAIITSPPYMNELDYVRDNRLRLWFIGRELPDGIELPAREREKGFAHLMRNVFVRIAPQIRRGGHIILVVGDATRGRGKTGRTGRIVEHLFEVSSDLQEFVLERMYQDMVPDIRRSRRECSGTKAETILIYRKA
jgi:methylase of polypeptide subunit release factors